MVNSLNLVILGLDPRTHSDNSRQINKRNCDSVHGMGPRVKPEDDVFGNTPLCPRADISPSRGEIASHLARP